MKQELESLGFKYINNGLLLAEYKISDYRSVFIDYEDNVMIGYIDHEETQEVYLFPYDYNNIKTLIQILR